MIRHFSFLLFVRAFVFVVSLWFVFAASAPACAQSFGPPVPTDLILVLLDKSGHQRFTLASYAAQWENPFRITVRTFSPALGEVVSEKVRVIASTPASPLFEGTYALSRRWSVGFWYNPIRGERLRQSVQLADVPVDLNLERDTDLTDVHVIYYAPHGLSAQLGYYHESGTIHNRAGAGPTGRDYTLASWNAWVTQRLDVRARGRVITPFVSFGYHPSSGLAHAASFLTGAAITFNERISLSGSLWLFDLSRPATRITGGLVVRR